jgi:hypothetical protein
MIKTLEELFDKLKVWVEEHIPQDRLQNDQQGRRWMVDSMPYDKELILKDLKEFTDRKQLNTEYKTAYKEKEVKSRKGISALKLEIGVLYSFNRCWVQRHKGRMHFYRDDLSQKGARVMGAVGYAAGFFKEFKKNLEKPG